MEILNLREPMISVTNILDRKPNIRKRLTLMHKLHRLFDRFGKLGRREKISIYAYKNKNNKLIINKLHIQYDNL